MTVNKMQERFNYALELQSLRNRIEELENQLKEDAKSAPESPRVFDVTLRLTTLSSTWTWGSESIDHQMIMEHFNDFLREMAGALNLVDDGDEIKVLNVKEVTNDNAELDA